MLRTEVYYQKVFWYPTVICESNCDQIWETWIVFAHLIKVHKICRNSRME